MVKLTFEEERVPLTVIEEGIIRIGKTKVALEGIISAYWQGYTPEEIQWCYDVVSLGDVYSVIGYYLHRKEEVDQYMQEYEKRWDKAVAELLSQPGAHEFYDRIKELRWQKELTEPAADQE